VHQTSLRQPDAYLCSRLAINVWYGKPSASARFWIASKSLLDRRMFSRRSFLNVAFCVRSPTMKIDPDEKQLLESVDFMPVLASPLALQTAAFNLSATSPRRESKSIYDVVG
jgi:hypothetical protein